MATLGDNKKSDYEFSQRFIDYIRTVMPGTKVASGGKELIAKCKYCADTKGHMYIKVPQSPSDVSMFNCFLCHASGIVDSKRLMEWSIYDPEIGGSLDKIEKESNKRKRVNGDVERIVYNFNNAIYDRRLAQEKLDYINNRIGTNLSLYDALTNKIVLNLRDALNYNNETIWNNSMKFTRAPDIVNQLNNHFVGFLSLDNNFVNLRKIHEVKLYHSIDSRYINYNIHGKLDNTEKFYVIPTVLNLASGTRVQIHVAEGPFDILSIRFNLRQDEQNGLFASINGSGYRGFLNAILNYLKIYYFDLHIYPDNDKHGNSEVMNSIINYVSPYGGSIYIHRNIMPGEKDFGVPLNRITESIIRV